jgi:hypothetical protein
MDGDSWIAPDPADIDLEATGRRAHFREVTVRAQDTPSQAGFPLHENYVVSDLGRLQRGRHSGDAASDDQYRFGIRAHMDLFRKLSCTPIIFPGIPRQITAVVFPGAMIPNCCGPFAG